MKTLYGMVLRTFIPVFTVTLFFFVVVFQLADIFGNLFYYISNDVSGTDIGLIALFYTPKCISYSLPMALLFAITFTMGNFYMNNELVAIFGSGVSLYRLSIPFIIIGLFLCLFYFTFEENLVIDSFKLKNKQQSIALKKPEPYTNRDFAIKTADNKIIYQPKFFNGNQQAFNEITILKRNEKNEIVSRIEARYGRWNGKNWVLEDCRIFEWKDGAGEGERILVEKFVKEYDGVELVEEPQIFTNQTRNIDEMHSADAEEWIKSLEVAGKPYQKELSDYHKKFAFSFTPLIAALISCSVGGILRKNVLLMSLLFSIAIFVIYYVVQMVTMALSSNGYITPFWGAWSSFVLFIFVGFGLMKIART